MSAVAVSQGELQRTFIAMLFAFAVSILMQQIAELLVVATGNWQFYLPGNEKSVFAKIWILAPAFTHSALALLMLSVSWVMWSKSKAAGHIVDIQEIFETKFITFLIEVLLVILYYALAKSAEGDFAAYSKEKNISAFIVTPSGKPEAAQMFAIFCTFAVWDAIVDVAKSPLTPLPTGRRHAVWCFARGVLTYCSVSLLCALAAIVVYLSEPVAQSTTHAVLADICLISVLLLFNQGKVLEHYLFKIFPHEESRKNTKRQPSRRGNITVLALVGVYLIALVAVILV